MNDLGSDADQLVKTVGNAAAGIVNGAVSNTTSLLQESADAAADTASLLFGGLASPEQGDISQFRVVNGKIRIKPKDFNTHVFNNHYLIQRCARGFLMVVAVGAAIALLITALFTVVAIPMEFFSSADRGDADAAALLDEHDITYKKARVPSWQHMFDLHPVWMGFAMAVATAGVILFFTLDWLKAHRDVAYYDRKDTNRRLGTERPASGTSWATDTYSRTLGMASSINTVVAHGVSLHSAYIDAGVVILMFALFPVFSSSQDALAFLFAILLGFLSAYCFVCNLKGLAVASRSSEVMPGIVFHLGWVIAYFIFVGVMPYDYYTDTAKWGTTNVRFGYWGFAAVILFHAVFVYFNAIMRTAKRITHGPGTFGRGSRITVTPPLVPVNPGDRTLVRSTAIGEDGQIDGAVYYLDVPYDDFWIAFIAPILASMWLYVGGFTWLIVSCCLIANNNIYTP